MFIDRVGMGLMPACSWHHAQQPLANESGIRQVGVE